MRVLHVTPYFAPAYRYGGPPRSVLGLCKALQRIGVDVEVLTTTADGEASLPAGRSDYEGVPVRYLPRGFPRRWFGARFGTALEDALGRADLCHVHGIWNVPEWRATEAARRRKLPYMISPRGMLQPAALRRNRVQKCAAYWLLERANLAGAARLHATAPDEAAVLATIVDHTRIVLVPNAVDAPTPLTDNARHGAGSRERGCFRAKLGLEASDPMVVFLGRVHPIKRLDLIADAVAAARVRFPSTHLVIAGPDDDNHLRSLAGRLEPLGAFVHHVGAVTGDDKWALLGDATALVLASDSESFGMVAAEAMAAGTPVVVTKTCGWTDIERCACGFSVDQDARSIAAALEALISNPNQAAAMGANGAALVRARYSWDVVAQAMAACYEVVASVRRAVA